MKKCGVPRGDRRPGKSTSQIRRPGPPARKCGVTEILMKKMWRKGNPNEKNVA